MLHTNALCVTTKKVSQNQAEIRLSVGEDRINYLDDCSLPMADLLTIKILLNSVISTPEARFMTMDIKMFYLNTPLKRYEYLHLKIEDIPNDIQVKYKLCKKVMYDGSIYVEIRKGMCGLP